MRISKALLFSAAAIGMTLAGCASTSTGTIKDQANRLTPCSGAPHCVSSKSATGSALHVDPFSFNGSREQAHAALLEVLRGQKDARIEADAMPMLHATFRTTIGFVDDVTFLFRDDASLIDVKSNSRLGFYDFGVNRRRVESLRTEFSRAMAEVEPAK